MNNKIALVALFGLLSIGTVSCASTDKTSSNAPDTNASTSADGSGTSSPNSTAGGGTSANSGSGTAASPAASTVKDNKDDATSKVRRDQLNADIRAREQRNNITGGDTDRDNSDLSSQVRSKLEANIPNGSLTVSAKDGEVVVSGTVPAQAQLAKIEPLAKQIKGVKTVKVAAKVAPASN
jgi:hyperosmotically inducible periplasmic protein